MLRLQDYLTKQQTLYGFVDLIEGLSGNIGTERRGISHIKGYILPYLSAEQKKQVAHNFRHHEDPEKMDNGKHGEKYNPNPEATTHTLAGKVNGHEADTPVKVIGARHDENGRIFAQTANHGEIPASKLNKPGELKRDRITEKGFEVERKIAENLGTKAAGSTGTAFDYAYRGKGGSNVEGKVRKMENDKPELAGESKLNKAKMGNSAVFFDPDTKKWQFSHQGLKHKFAEAKHPGSGLPILEHLNEHHSDGKIAKGFTVPAAKGTAKRYLEGLGVNSLHLHKNDVKKSIDHGTTYTIDSKNNLQGKTKLSHLSDDDLHRLDGKLTIEKTTTGSARAAHVPNFKTFSEYADNSKVDPENHRDLTNSEHASEFKGHIDSHMIRKQNKAKRKQENNNSMENPYINKESIEQILDNVMKNNLVESTDSFKTVLSNKIAARLLEAKKSIYSERYNKDLDKNKNGKLDSDDFKKLRTKKHKCTATCEETVEEGIGSMLGLSTTKGKPDWKKAPKWATHLGRTHEGAFHWLDKNTALTNKSSDSYYPNAGKIKFSGHVDTKKGIGYVEQKPTNEETMKQMEDALNEVLNPSMGVKAYIDDFIKSDDSRFEGDSKDKRRQRAIAAFYNDKK
jgi:hypothetical protein